MMTLGLLTCSPRPRSRSLFSTNLGKSAYVSGTSQLRTELIKAMKAHCHSISRRFLFNRTGVKVGSRNMHFQKLPWWFWCWWLKETLPVIGNFWHGFQWSLPSESLDWTWWLVKVMGCLFCGEVTKGYFTLPMWHLALKERATWRPSDQQSARKWSLQFYHL